MGFCINCPLAPEMDGQTRFHRFRYHLGRGFVTGKDLVLDIGSGCGYGTAMLSEVAMYVIGIEKEKAEVDGAIKNYKLENNEFVCADLETMFIPKCDVACAFEIVEHLYKPKDFIQKLKEKTKKFIIFSVPIGERLVWVEEANEYQAEKDSCHKSVFNNKDEIMNMFVDDNWKEFMGIQVGVTFIGIVYNKNSI